MLCTFRVIGFKILGIFVSNFLFVQSQSNIATCNDFTIDTCHFNDGAIIETVKDVSESNCQFFCHNIYSRDMKYITIYVFVSFKTIIIQILIYLDPCMSINYASLYH